MSCPQQPNNSPAVASTTTTTTTTTTIRSCSDVALLMKLDGATAKLKVTSDLSPLDGVGEKDVTRSILVFGNSRVGKSEFLKQLCKKFGATVGFVASSDYKPCTMGADYVLLKCNDGTNLLVIDCEGLRNGKTSHHNLLLTSVYSICSCAVYMSDSFNNFFIEDLATCVANTVALFGLEKSVFPPVTLFVNKATSDKPQDLVNGLKEKIQEDPQDKSNNNAKAAIRTRYPNLALHWCKFDSNFASSPDYLNALDAIYTHVVTSKPINGRFLPKESLKDFVKRQLNAALNAPFSIAPESQADLVLRLLATDKVKSLVTDFNTTLQPIIGTLLAGAFTTKADAELVSLKKQFVASMKQVLPTNIYLEFYDSENNSGILISELDTAKTLLAAENKTEGEKVASTKEETGLDAASTPYDRKIGEERVNHFIGNTDYDIYQKHRTYFKRKRTAKTHKNGSITYTEWQSNGTYDQAEGGTWRVHVNR